MNHDHAQQVGLRVPDPLFATAIAAGRQVSCHTPLAAGSQPDPDPATGESNGRPLRWAYYPHDRHLHLLTPAEVLCATGQGHAPALCGRVVPARGLTLTDDSSRPLCGACIIGVPAGSEDPGPREAAARSLAGDRAASISRAPAMPTAPPRPASGPWRDAEGTLIALHSRVEQVAVDTEHGALASRLHQQGKVIGRGTNLVYVLFEHTSQLIALRPHLLRVLDTPDGC